MTGARLQCRVLDKNLATEEGFVSATTMHLARSMEFRVVAVMACDGGHSFQVRELGRE